jgi:hypothetical protein
VCERRHRLVGAEVGEAAREGGGGRAVLQSCTAALTLQRSRPATTPLAGVGRDMRNRHVRARTARNSE